MLGPARARKVAPAQEIYLALYQLLVGIEQFRNNPEVPTLAQDATDVLTFGIEEG